MRGQEDVDVIAGGKLLAVGDIFRHQGTLYKVFRYVAQTRTILAHSVTGAKVELPVEIQPPLFSPHRDWYVVSVKTSSPIVTLFKPQRSGALKELLPLCDGTPTDSLRSGGPIFINPLVGMQYGESLVARHQNGSMSKVPIPRLMATTKEIQESKESPLDPYRDVMPLQEF